jgi:hypothetical protein
MENNIQKIFEYIINLINTLATLLIGVALVGFLFGILKYFRTANDPGKRKESKKYMTYGLFSMFVIVSFWGLILLVGNVFGLNLRPNNGDYLNNLSGNSDDEINLGTNLQENNSIFNQDASGDELPPTNLIDTANPNPQDFFGTQGVNDDSGDGFNAGYDDFSDN